MATLALSKDGCAGHRIGLARLCTSGAAVPKHVPAALCTKNLDKQRVAAKPAVSGDWPPLLYSTELSRELSASKSWRIQPRLIPFPALWPTPFTSSRRRHLRRHRLRRRHRRVRLDRPCRRGTDGARGATTSLPGSRSHSGRRRVRPLPNCRFAWW